MLSVKKIVYWYNRYEPDYKERQRRVEELAKKMGIDCGFVPTSDCETVWFVREKTDTYLAHGKTGIEAELTRLEKALEKLGIPA
ncbi:hypothetical protein HYW76_05185 [Candidatus Pacearchaeota archaeon]|nr:hypothetical protein [Candidatus Pacearchaeota archaeon]